jgi:hypothetical protein
MPDLGERRAGAVSSSVGEAKLCIRLRLQTGRLSADNEGRKQNIFFLSTEKIN